MQSKQERYRALFMSRHEQKIELEKKVDFYKEIMLASTTDEQWTKAGEEIEKIYVLMRKLG